MRKYMKKTAALLIAGALGASMLVGCGSKPIDGTAVAAVVNEEEIPMGVVSLLARYQQVKTAAMYSGMLGYDSNTFWDMVNDEETGETYGESTVKDVAEQLQKMYLQRAKAPEYEVALSEEEQQAVTDAAAAFMEANSEEVIQKLAVTQADVETFLELSAYQIKMHNAIIKDVDPNVTDEEAQQTTLTYSKMAFDEESTEEEKAEAKATAQEILDAVLATADADMKEIAQGIDEESTTINIHYATNDPEDDTVADFLKEAVAGLTDGEVNASLIEGDDGYYVVRLEKQFDEEATKTRKTAIVNEREEELYQDTLEKWVEEAEITTDEKVLSTLQITGKEVFQEVQSGVTPEEEAAPEELEVETEAE